MAKTPKLMWDNLDELLGATEQPQGSRREEIGCEGIKEMLFEKMKPFPNHRFRLYEGQRLIDMADSIRQMGILLPIILWHTADNEYIILSGHNRIEAGRLAGLTKGPVIIKEDISYEDAVLIVTETNLRQRSFSDLSHSERAYCLAQHYEAIKSQGKRNDLVKEIEDIMKVSEINASGTSAQVVQKLDKRKEVGSEYGLSHYKVARYIRLATLPESLLLKVDSGEIAVLAGYALSFVEDEKLLGKIAELLENGYKLEVKKAEMMKQYFETGKLDMDIIMEILSGEKMKKPKTGSTAVTIRPTIYNKYFSNGQNKKEIAKIMEAALALYFEFVGSEREKMLTESGK